MLVFSYILTASLEGALTYLLYLANGEVPFIYALLLFSSLISIPIETSAAGEALRKKAKENGQNLDLYDIVGNFVRVVIYLAVLRGFLSPEDGGTYACICIGVTAILSMVYIDTKKIQ